MKLGEIIKEYRDEHKLSMDAFAKKSGMTKGYISMLEKNEHPKSKKPIIPTNETISKVAKGIGVDIDTILEKLDPEQEIQMNVSPKDMSKKTPSNITPLLSSQPEITQIYNTLSQDSKTKLLKYAKLLQEADSIEYYEVIATTKLSAGLGYAFNEYDQERVYVANRPPKHDLASFVYGDSMEPKFQSGELVYLVDKGLSSYDGEICAVAYDGDTFIKRVYTEAGKLRLVSLNPKYEDIIIDFPPADGEFIRIYEVVGSDMTVPI
ncbi:hypothetical protein A9Q68_10190 [Streptococcus bovimastitidis]|uniref:HTH cro/C1-type domain-containing protein n=1 Tax=Streptococcus bovimastitidis TaxID=1856638 RepID=A0A1L8MJX3_9STRE|nr:XRE family transcriptional regulator [Streptococcus bovimastitidis]OJF71082.1 hypothetical protein A9Q68_10190 [Streptococcus bovimastitidis]